MNKAVELPTALFINYNSVIRNRVRSKLLHGLWFGHP